MSVFSRLRGLVSPATGLFARQKAQRPLSVARLSVYRRMEVRASTYTWRQFYDDVHFYLCLTGIPVLILITAVNIRVGPATLTDIPEGYEPQQHEYYRHPITRFLVKYMIETPQSIYERSMYSIKVIKDEGEMEALYKKVEMLHKERGDYRDWYYVPTRAELTTRRNIRDVEVAIIGDYDTP